VVFLNTLLQSLKSLLVFLVPQAVSSVVAPATGTAENFVPVVGVTGVVGVVVDATGVVDAVVGVVDAVVGVAGVAVDAAGVLTPMFQENTSFFFFSYN